MRSFLLLVGLSLPQIAWSHSPIAGIGQFYGGLLHPLMVPAHALALTVFALLIGQSGIRAMRLGYPPFMLCLAVGLVLAGFDISLGLNSEQGLLVIALLCAALVALQWRPPLSLFAVLGTGLGVLIGADSGVQGLSRQETFAALLGCWLGATIALIVVAGVVELLQRPWQRIGVRVIGSWGVASSVLVLALTTLRT
ncbi:HupE/UreJ family protein [Parahaliea sp. F7430]|uniref:HupE/UreJ family protein n=1 Tax=Sediminihaliea albiluteola TaxID=2758564 RepID=A0A7W2TV75_9GAMM|nr:HupE/UreJ family protein [Sediminihaliea albiluteola]MBA6412510.1 HupE/UreJ family protein [Sediminihaliea albiluteola]